MRQTFSSPLNNIIVLPGTKSFSHHLTAGERLKHAFYVQQHDDLAAKGALDGILEDLTDDDICMLMETEEEVRQCSDRGSHSVETEEAYGLG